MSECNECNGTGQLYISCCGDDMRFNINETDLCPTCLEHCGEEGEECDVCSGTGVDPDAPFELTTKYYVITKSKSHLDHYIFKSIKTKSCFLMSASLDYVLSLE